MRVSPQAAAVFEGGRASYQAGRRPAFPLGEEAVGWMAARYGLFPTNEPLPWTLPPASEEQRLIASGRALAERLRSELRHFQSTRPGGLHDEQLNELLALVNQWVAALTQSTTVGTAT